MKKSFLVIIPIFSFLVLLPFDCGTVISKDGGIFESENMGETWMQLSVEGEVSLARLNILSLAISTSGPDIMYAGTRIDGIYKGFNQGQIWQKLNDQNGVLDSRANVYDIAIDDKNVDRLYIGAYQNKKGRVFRSQDGGQSWEEVYVVSEEGYAVFAVAVDNYDSSVVYIGTAQGGFLKSTDYGKSWKIMRWFDDVISDIVINPKDTRQVYVSTFDQGIYKTSDKGLTWQSFKEVLEGFSQAQGIENLIIDMERTNILYAGSKYGLLTSKNSGQTWQEVAIIMPPESEPVLSLAIDPQNTDHLYYGAGSILYRSLDQGVNWTVHELNSGRNIKNIVINPQDPNKIFVGMHE
ncbi:hypothetical protein KKH07_00265 [Patescibacteria group bacterium]|nr:hypothetical protein [Patescibacteria group bacterium]MBU1563624.1 hypothetical protein [Patescibacteria group bacterium]MBU2068038.1 hypothetical protein [Patescibacteria group bacterium]